MGTLIDQGVMLQSDLTVGSVALIADSDAVFRKSFVGIFEQFCRSQRILEAGSLAELMQKLDEDAEVSLAVIEISSSLLSKNEDITSIRDAYPNLRLVVIANSHSRDNILSAIYFGAHGYIIKTSGSQRIGAALNTVIAGEIALPGSVASLVRANHATEQALPAGRKRGLTTRQKQILRLIRAGKSNKEIANALGLMENTIKVHVHALYRAMGVNNRRGAAASFQRILDRRPLAPGRVRGS